LKFLDVVEHFRRTIDRFAFFIHLAKRIGPRRTEIGSAVAVPATHRFAIEFQHFRRRIHQAAPAIK